MTNTIDPTLLRLIRAATQAIANECSAILGEPTPAETAFNATVPATPPAEAEQPAAPAPAKRTRAAKAAPAAAEPVVVTPPAPAPADATAAFQQKVYEQVTAASQALPPAAPAPAPAVNLPPQSNITDDELAELAASLAADPQNLAKYRAWRDASDFWQEDGSQAKCVGFALSKIPNVGDNRDRIMEAMKRAMV